MDTHSPQVARQGGARPLGASGSDPPQPVVVPQRSWDSVVSPSLAHIVLPYGRGRAAGSLDSGRAGAWAGSAAALQMALRRKVLQLSASRRRWWRAGQSVRLPPGRPLRRLGAESAVCPSLSSKSSFSLFPCPAFGLDANYMPVCAPSCSLSFICWKRSTFPIASSSQAGCSGLCPLPSCRNGPWPVSLGWGPPALGEATVLTSSPPACPSAALWERLRGDTGPALQPPRAGADPAPVPLRWPQGFH